MNLTGKSPEYIAGVRDRLAFSNDCVIPDVALTMVSEWQAGWSCADAELNPMETALSRVQDAIQHRLRSLEANHSSK